MKCAGREYTPATYRLKTGQRGYREAWCTAVERQALSQKECPMHRSREDRCTTEEMPVVLQTRCPLNCSREACCSTEKMPVLPEKAPSGSPGYPKAWDRIPKRLPFSPCCQHVTESPPRKQRLFVALKSGRRDLNPRHPPWQGGALPLSYSRDFRRWWSAREGTRTLTPEGTRS